MKVGFFADTHDNLPMIKKAVGVFNQRQVDLVIHLGDYVSPFFFKAIDDLRAALVGVFGNNDGDRLMLTARFKEKGFDLFPPPHSLNLKGHRILMLHEPFELEAFIRSGDYRIVSYAHTHVHEIRKEKGCLVVNPGECGGWLYGKSTLACVDLDILEGEIIGI